MGNMIKVNDTISEEEFNKLGAWGLHTIMELYECSYGTMRDGDAIKKHVKDLCKLIDMTLFGDTIAVDFGKDPRVTGYSMLQLIETSNLSAHYSNKYGAIFFDIFSCKWYDQQKAVDFTKEFFGAKRVGYIVIPRGIDIERISRPI